MHQRKPTQRAERAISRVVRPMPAGGLSRLWQALLNSIDGLTYAARQEKSFRFEMILFGASLPLALVISDSYFKFSILVACGLAVMSIELLNTSIEKACDLISKDYTEGIKHAKDCGSAAVLLSAIGCSFVWGEAVVSFLIRLQWM